MRFILRKPKAAWASKGNNGGHLIKLARLAQATEKEASNRRGSETQRRREIKGPLKRGEVHSLCLQCLCAETANEAVEDSGRSWYRGCPLQGIIFAARYYKYCPSSQGLPSRTGRDYSFFAWPSINSMRILSGPSMNAYLILPMLLISSVTFTPSLRSRSRASGRFS